MKPRTFIRLPSSPPSSSASLNPNVGHYSVAMKTHSQGHLDTSDRRWQTSAHESVCIAVQRVSRVCLHVFPLCLQESPRRAAFLKCWIATHK